jgi:hypothetical protein
MGVAELYHDRFEKQKGPNFMWATALSAKFPIMEASFIPGSDGISQTNITGFQPRDSDLAGLSRCKSGSKILGSSKDQGT